METNLSLFFLFISALDNKTLTGSWWFRQCCTYWCWSVLGATTSFCLTAPQQSCCIISWSCRHWKMSQHSKNSWDLLPIDQTCEINNKVFDPCWTCRFLACRSLAIQNPRLEYPTNSLCIQTSVFLINFLKLLKPPLCIHVLEQLLAEMCAWQQSCMFKLKRGKHYCESSRHENIEFDNYISSFLCDITILEGGGRVFKSP